MPQERQAYAPIEDYGLIGDTHSAALVDSRGSIDWLCLPRFDAPSVFARILDLQHGGMWTLSPSGSFRSRHRYVDRTNVLETTFRTDAGTVRLLDFMPISREESGPFRPAHALMRVVECITGEVEMESHCEPRPDYARREVTFEVRGTRVEFDEFTMSGPTEWERRGRQGVASRFRLAQGERAAFVLQYTGTGWHEAAVALPDDPSEALEKTLEHWRLWADRCTYEGPYRESVVRSVLTLKLLTDSPTGAIIAAPTTSLPEEIGGERNWDYRFSWIRDASFTLYALLLAGYRDEDDAFFGWIARNVNLEREGIAILHPITPQAETTEQILDHLEGYRGSRPVRLGNAAAQQLQLDVYGEALDALYFACRAADFNATSVWAHFHPLVDWVADNWRKQDSGIWEVRGGVRHFVYSKVMLWVALDRGLRLVEEYGLDGDVVRWRQEADELRREVLDRGYSERLGAFTQSYEDERLDASNLLLPIVGFIDGDDPRMQGTIDATLDVLVDDGLCYRYLDAPEGLAGGEATFVLCTFWLVDALIEAGREQEAQEIFEGVLARATGLGLFAEEIDPASGAHLGNFPQAFSHIGLVYAAVSLARVGKSGAVRTEDADAVRAADTGRAAR